MTPSESAADLVLAGGPVVTMDAVRRTSSAVAVRGGRVVAGGSLAGGGAPLGPPPPPAQPARPWILGDGWYMEAFPGGTPSRNDLDAAAPDRPAFFVNRDAHGAWVNSRAPALAGAGRATPGPPDGRT